MAGLGVNQDLDTVAAEFRRDGACVVRGLLDDDEVAQLVEGVERNLAEPSERAIEGGGDTGSGRFFEDFRNWTRIAPYEAVIRGSRLGTVAAALMGSRTVRLHHDHLLVKEPGTTIRTPWHQDQPYYNIDGADTVSFWIPLDPVPRESTLEFVAGSHASRTWYMPRGFFDDRPLVFDEGTFAEVPDVDADRDAHATPRVGAGAGGRRRVQHAHAPRGRRLAQPAARVLGPAGRRRRTARGAPARHEPDVPGARRRAGPRRRARPSAVPAARLAHCHDLEVLGGDRDRAAARPRAALDHGEQGTLELLRAVRDRPPRTPSAWGRTSHGTSTRTRRRRRIAR